MTDEINPSELGAFTNNLSNKEGLKKLCEKVNAGGSGTTYTAGENIQISAENVISATDTKYTAGENIAISEENVISATDTKYTAGTGISISEQNVISATGSGSSDWTRCTSLDTFKTLISIDENGNFESLKDIVFVGKPSNDTLNAGDVNFYIPKGYKITSTESSLQSPIYALTGFTTTPDNTLKGYCIKLVWQRSSTPPAFSNIYAITNTYTFTIDNSDIKINLTRSTSTFNFSSAGVYYK